MNPGYRIFACFLLLLPFVAYPQISNKRCRWIKYTREDFTLDSLTAFPSSVKIAYPEDPGFRISYDVNSGKARLSGPYQIDSALICYAVLPYQLHKTRFRRNVSLYDSNLYYREDYGIRNKPIATREEIFSSPGLQKTGNISRGISFGNNQNVFVNSTLNLQMEGRITEDISLTAVISDQNIPFQPQGNTQQLQQFDKVYVQLESKKAKLIVGDLVMKNKSSNFLRYYRNVQGGQFEYNNVKDSSHYTSISSGAAIAKGKFSTMLFAPGQPDSLQEGVQGPYRLRGANGERFIVVLANSEKVYLDGRLLKRGFDFDYVIDYNQSEITFTNNLMITRFTRLRIDFEYSDRNYSRSIYNAGYYQKAGRFSAFVAYYQEKDNPRNPLTLSLKDQDKQNLSLVGDSINKAFVSGVDTVAFNASQVLYKIDTAGGVKFYKYSTSPDSAFYQINFSDVGSGNGSYILLNSTANGKVYKYTGPGFGNFEPVRLIPTPKLKQMTTAGVGFEISKYDNIYAEFAVSKNDLNLYSPVNDQDNIGKSFKGGYINKGKPLGFSKKYKWNAAVDYEYNQKTFTAIDRFRGPEFERDWSENIKTVADNHIFNASAGFFKNSKNNFQYRISRRIKGTDVNGTQQQYTLNQSFGKFSITNGGFLMKNDQLLDKSDWRRFNVNTYYASKYIVPGIIYNMDKNKVTDATGRVIHSAMYFDEVKFYVKNNDSLKTKYSSDYSIRKDKHVSNGTLTDFTSAKTVNVGFNTRFKQKNEINSTLTYRYLEYKDTTGGKKLPNEETILGRTDWNTNLLKNHVRSELTVTTGTGRELKKQYIFVPAQGGTGNYIWQDQNNDGVQDLNEFVEINSSYTYTNTVTYIKTFVPTDQYYKAYTNTFNYRLDLTAPRGWKDKSKIKIFISKFSNVSSWTINKKITDANLWHRFSPAINNVDSANVLSLQKSVKSTLFFNRSNPQYGMDLNYSSTDQKQFLNQGFETRGNDELKLNSRLNIKRFLNIKLLTLKGVKTNFSNFLTSKNFKVVSYKITPEISFQPKNSIRFSWNLSYTYKENMLRPANREKVIMYQAGFDLKVNMVSRRTINSDIKYIKIATKNFNLDNTRPEQSSVASPIGYEMLEALQPGDNFTWNINWLEKLSNGLQLTFSYEGRKAGTAKVVNIGRMQVSALF
jgi:hypothetical protein